MWLSFGCNGFSNMTSFFFPSPLGAGGMTTMGSMSMGGMVGMGIGGKEVGTKMGSGVVRMGSTIFVRPSLLQQRYKTNSGFVYNRSFQSDVALWQTVSSGQSGSHELHVRYLLAVAL